MTRRNMAISKEQKKDAIVAFLFSFLALAGLI